MTNRREEWENMLDEFLVKLYEKSSGKGIILVAREDIARELGWDKIRTKNIVDELVKRDYVATKAIGNKIIITDYGKDYVRDLGLDKQ